MSEILLATTADHLFDDISATLARPGTQVSRITHGVDVAAAVAELKPDVVLLDLQIGNMGGAAACRNLRLEQGADRLPDTKVIILLDREVDIWMAKQAGADLALTKPLDSLKLRRSIRELLSIDAA